MFFMVYLCSLVCLCSLRYIYVLYFFVVLYVLLAPEGVFCLSYANMDGVPTQTAGTSELLASDWNTYVRDNFDSIKFGHIVCTSTTRPTGIAEGTMIYETDTNKVLVYNGSSWVEVNDLDSTDGVSTSAQTKLDTVGLIHIATATATSGSALSVNDCFSSTYENYLITGFGEVVSNYASCSLRLRVGGVDTAGSSYSWGQAGGHAGGGVQNTGDAASSVFFLPQISIADRHGFTATISKPNEAKRTQFHGYGNGQGNIGGVDRNYSSVFGGAINDSTVYTGFTIVTGNTIVQLKVRVYGFRKS
jgi:hypothetical protein